MTSDTWNEPAVPCSNFPDNVFGVAQILSRQSIKCPHGESVSPRLQCSRLASPIVLTSGIIQVPQDLSVSMLPCLASQVKTKIGVAQCPDACNRMISNAVPQRVALPDAMLQIPRTSFLGLPGKGPAGDSFAGTLISVQFLRGQERSALTSRKASETPQYRLCGAHPRSLTTAVARVVMCRLLLLWALEDRTVSLIHGGVTLKQIVPTSLFDAG